MGRRSAWAYALVPRPQELLLKPLVLLMGFAAGRWAGTGTGPPLLAFLGLAVAVEPLAYQARYALNDLLDARLDALHPAAAARRRLPPGPAARRWAVASIAVRAVAAVLVAALLPAPVGAVCGAAVLAIAASAAVYEAVRQRLRRAAPMEAVGRLTPAVASLYGLVGAGFAIRLAAGMAAAGAPLPALGRATLFAWPLGMLFTTMAWTLQATSFVRPDWSALDQRIRYRRQLGPLLRWCGALPSEGRPPATAPMGTAVLAPAGAVRGVAMLAGMAGLGGAAVLGSSLATQFGIGETPWPAALAMGATCGLGGFASLRLMPASTGWAMPARTGRASPAAILTGTLTATLTATLTGAATVAVAAAASAPRPLLAGLPVVALLLTALSVRRLTYGSMSGFGLWARSARPAGRQSERLDHRLHLG